MSLDRYLLFVAGSVLLVVTPGPDMAYLLARSLAQGRKAGIVAALGFNAGGYCHLAAALLGLSAMLAASPHAFTAVKWLGAGYLIYLGLQALFSSRRAELFPTQDVRPRRLRLIFWQAFLSDVLNPKVGVFFLAFLPQFVDRSGPGRTQQLVLLGVTVCVIALAINIPLVFVASRVSERLRRNGATSHHLTRLMGAVFILIGLQVALT
ncbi:MAG TPA: LysE family translocator [Longimicrobiaceae bacterium]